MQDQSALISTFLHRTDALASRLRINVQELPDVLGVSRRTLFAGRSDNHVVTPKTWLKLEEAERRAGVVAASEKLTRRHVAAAEAAGGSEEERQARFEEADAPRVEMVAEINRLRDENAELRTKLAAVRKALE